MRERTQIVVLLLIQKWTLHEPSYFTVSLNVPLLVKSDKVVARVPFRSTRSS